MSEQFVVVGDGGAQQQQREVVPQLERRKYKKSPKVPTACVVCAARSQFKYYNAHSCDGCKQFFRRAVVGQKMYYCRRKSNCNIKNDIKCRSCRLDQCLVEGMDYTMVVVEQSPQTNTFFAMLAERRLKALHRRRNNQQQQQQEHDTGEAPSQQQEEEQQNANNKYYEFAFGGAKEAHSDSDEGRQSSSTVRFERGLPIRMVGTASASFSSAGNATPVLRGGSPPASATGALCSLDKAIECSQTVCALATTEMQLRLQNAQERAFREGLLERLHQLAGLLAASPQGAAKHTAVASVLRRVSVADTDAFVGAAGGGKACSYPLIVECLSVVDLFRSMPFFGRLPAEDQTTLLNYTGLPLVELNARYYSSQMNAAPAGALNPLFLYCCADHFGPLNGFQSVMERLQCKAMRKFNQVQLQMEEFLLLRALMLCHPATGGLSRAAQTLLQQEAERYARTLLQYLQTRLDHFAGAKRYAELLSLAESVFRMGEKHREFFAHLGALTEQGLLLGARKGDRGVQH